MIGAIAGDIIGSIYEPGLIKTKEFPLFGEGCRFMDDTVMTIAVAPQVPRRGRSCRPGPALPARRSVIVRT